MGGTRAFRCRLGALKICAKYSDGPTIADGDSHVLPRYDKAVRSSPMHEPYECSACGAEIPAAGDACPRCGHRDAVAHPSGVAARTELGELGVAAEQYDAEGRRMTQALEGPLDRGMANEPRVAEILVAHLREAEGGDVSWEEGDNQRGEDFAVRLPDDRRQSVQVTMAVPNEQPWRDLGRSGSAKFSMDFDELVHEVRAAIEAKCKLGREERREMWLALDAYLTPSAARREIADAYLRAYGSPCEEFGFAAVWLIGSTPGACIKLCQL